MVNPRVFLNSTYERETPRAHVDMTYVRTWSFTFAYGVLRANVKLELHARTWYSRFARQPCLRQRLYRPVYIISGLRARFTDISLTNQLADTSTRWQDNCAVLWPCTFCSDRSTTGHMKIRVTRHFGPRTLRPQDTSAPVPKCPGHFGTGAKVSRDTSAPLSVTYTRRRASQSLNTEHCRPLSLT